jgi:hypothetical protein
LGFYDQDFNHLSWSYIWETMVVVVPFCSCIKHRFDCYINNKDHADDYLVQYLLGDFSECCNYQALFVDS